MARDTDDQKQEKQETQEATLVLAGSVLNYSELLVLNVIIGLPFNFKSLNFLLELFSTTIMEGFKINIIILCFSHIKDSQIILRYL